ncbi:MAG: nitrogenase iron protein [Erysipelotrichia bacterium]|nr:nitrogenase iron protein [Erysipelotrichia bacterium]
MIQFAVYGKGGIGKSTTVSNISAALAENGLSVLQIGCDPKADSTASLLNGNKPDTIIDLIRSKGKNISLEEMTATGCKGVICAETGGPTPGLGCAGRAISAALELLREKGAYTALNPDVVIYDVLGDVVCGGFSVPMRQGYADRIYILTSGENMAIHAGAGIAMAVENFQNRGYAHLGGIILNKRNVKNETEKVQELAEDIHSEIVGVLSRSDIVQEAEDLNKTVIEAFPDSDMANEYRALAKAIMRQFGKEMKTC